MSIETKSTAKIRFIDCDPIGHLNNSKYLDYMLNAREDHVEDNYGVTYQDIIKQTGSTWVTIQNEIAYLKEVRANSKVVITSRTIDSNDRIAKIEILMMNEEETVVHAVLWMTLIYFNMKTRRSEPVPEETKAIFTKNMESLEQKDFNKRVSFFRIKNKNA